MSSGQVWSKKLSTEIAKAILGQEETIERMFVALLAGGHILLEGMPGLAKTLLIRSLGSALGVKVDRIQFTPDLLPSDVVGTMIFSPKTGEFTAHKGPIFANLVLADEINRAPAKVQSALLEAMQEKQSTIGGQTFNLPKPFFVMATQNPVEQDGTYPLPEAQMDRFLFKLVVDYPSSDDEMTMMDRWGQITQQPTIEAVSSGEELLELRKEVDKIYVSTAIKAYILALVRASRDLAKPVEAGVRMLNWGASPRACLGLLQAGRALAFLRGEDHVSPEHVQIVLMDVMRHRIGLSYEAEAEGVTSTKILTDLVNRVAIPTASVKAA